jgi:hypothetical protein
MVINRLHLSNATQAQYLSLVAYYRQISDSSIYLHSSKSKISGKTGVPNPVTGSHPFVTGKPSTPHEFVLPAVISVKPLYPLLYSHGFKKPSVGLLWEMRASLTSARMEDASGQEAEVPEIVERVWFQKKAK